MRAVRGRTFAAVALCGVVDAKGLGCPFGQESRPSTCDSRGRAQAGGHHAQDVGGRNGISLVREPDIAREQTDQSLELFSSVDDGLDEADYDCCAN